MLWPTAATGTNQTRNVDLLMVEATSDSSSGWPTTAWYVRAPAREARREPNSERSDVVVAPVDARVGRHYMTSSARFSCVTYGAIGGCLGNCFIGPMSI